MHHYIITGASRGIGAAIAEQLLDLNHVVMGVARSDNPGLKALADEKGAPLRYYQQDLSESFNVPHFTQYLLSEIDRDDVHSISLIHNAGLLEPIALIGQESSPEQTTRAFNVNLLAPMLMTETFVAHVQDWPVEKRVLGISSGAAFNPYPGWSTYCTTKAGLDMMLRVLATEQQQHPYPVKVLALAPGVVDTEMQTLIREQTPENFPPVERFHDLKNNGELWSADFVAKHTIEMLHHADFGEKVQVDLRHELGGEGNG
mgnify:CR=1 FL=1